MKCRSLFLFAISNLLLTSLSFGSNNTPNNENVPPYAEQSTPPATPGQGWPETPVGLPLEAEAAQPADAMNPIEVGFMTPLQLDNPSLNNPPGRPQRRQQGQNVRRRLRMPGTNFGRNINFDNEDFGDENNPSFLRRRRALTALEIIRLSLAASAVVLHVSNGANLGKRKR